MKYTKLDKLGRVVIPASMRKNIGIQIGSPLEIHQADDAITVKLSKMACRLCGNGDIANGELLLCDKCIQKIKSL